MEGCQCLLPLGELIGLLSFSRVQDTQHVQERPMLHVCIQHVPCCLETWKRALSRGPLNLQVYNLNSNKERGEVFSNCLERPGDPIRNDCFLTVELRKPQTPIVFQCQQLPPEVGAAVIRHDRHSKLPILRLKATFCDVKCSKYQYEDSVFSLLMALFSILNSVCFTSRRGKTFVSECLPCRKQELQ